MKRINGMMYPTTRRKRTKVKYICADCKDTLTPSTAFFYVDGCNFAITENSLPLCRECYRKKYNE